MYLGALHAFVEASRKYVELYYNTVYGILFVWLFIGIIMVWWKINTKNKKINWPPSPNFNSRKWERVNHKDHWKHSNTYL